MTTPKNGYAKLLDAVQANQTAIQTTQTAMLNTLSAQTTTIAVLNQKLSDINDRLFNVTDGAIPRLTKAITDIDTRADTGIKEALKETRRVDKRITYFSGAAAALATVFSLLITWFRGK